MISLDLPDLEATRVLGAALGRSLCLSQGESLFTGNVILLYGDLGSGKTTLVQSLGAALGITDAIVSPTFTLINEYPEGRIPLYHLDLYRLQPQEVVELHPEHYWQGEEFPPGIVAIEWPERLPSKPEDYLQIYLRVTDDQSRRAELTPVGRFLLPDLMA